jgi:hypothetical protein
LPAHAIATGAEYNASPSQDDALFEIAAWFGNAELLLASLRRQILERRLAASPVRCWPHHFDIATLITHPTRNAGAITYVGAGLSPGDEHYPGPYFYVSVYPKPDQSPLPELPSGHWHTHEFTAAVLTWDKVLISKEQKAVSNDFLCNAVAAVLKISA